MPPERSPRPHGSLSRGRSFASLCCSTGSGYCPGLLLWSLPLPTIVELAWSVLYIPPGTVVGIMSRLTTLETDITSSGYKVVVPRRGAGGSVLVVLWEVGALH